MIKEIYTRTQDDPYFEDGVLEYSNEVEEIISQIRVVLATKPTDVIGSADFGVDLEYMVFKTRQAGNTIKAKVDAAIDKYVVKSPNISITTEINFGHVGDGSDYAVLDIYINGAKAVGFLINKE